MNWQAFLKVLEVFGCMGGALAAFCGMAFVCHWLEANVHYIAASAACFTFISLIIALFVGVTA